jgi:hypothetical protein
MTPDQLMLQLLDMADCGQGWISEDNDHPDDIPDSWREAIKEVGKLTGSTINVDEHFPPHAIETETNSNAGGYDKDGPIPR